MDVDGTMTDGGVTLLSQTEDVALEIKTFDAHDGQGLTPAHTAGREQIHPWLSGQTSGIRGSNSLIEVSCFRYSGKHLTSPISGIEFACSIHANQTRANARSTGTGERAFC
jgi:hypothetical protein